MSKLYCPSMMCADFDRLAEEVKELDQANVDIFHCDVMDGTFVPNITMGIHDIQAIRKNTTRMVDVHLMISNPFSKLDWFINAGVDLIYIHPEADPSPTKSLNYIKEKGLKAGIAINPSTALSTIMPALSLSDYVMVMSVEPGFSGQKYLEFVNEKIIELKKLTDQYAFKIMVDGAISPEKITTLSALGVDGFILGTSTLFNKNRPYSKIITELKEENF